MPLILHAYHIPADGKAVKIPRGELGLPRPKVPWTDSGLGFWYVTAIIIGIGAIQMMIFKLMKWI